MAGFDGMACGYDVVMRPVESAYLGKLRRGFFGQSGGRVLELGVGTGNNRPRTCASPW